jgi:GT2 family glycosyltransferase
VSILIVTHRQHQLLARCLESLELATRGIDAETIVVVNGVPMRSEHHMAARRGATILPVPVNLGLPGGLQYARSQARGRYLAIVQDDVIVDEGWLRPLIDVLESDPSVGEVGSRMASLEGEVYGEGMFVSRNGFISGVAPVTRENPTWAVDACFSAACLVRAAAWDSIGGPNHRLFPLGKVDVDLGLRLNAAGWSVLLAGASIARHQRHASTSSWLRRYLDEHNRRILLRNNRRFLASRPRGVLTVVEVNELLLEADERARRRRTEMRPHVPAQQPKPLARLKRCARVDALRVKVGLGVFRVRSALGYRLRAAGRLRARAPYLGDSRRA